MKAFQKKYQLIIFFALTLIIGWFPWYTNTGQGSVLWYGPTLAGLITAALTEGKDGLLAIWQRMTRWRVNIRWYLIVLLFPAAILLAGVAVHVMLGGTAPHFPLLKQNQYLILFVLLSALFPLQSALMQEIGWRGYALEKTQQKWGPLPGTLILGTFFGAWLLPEFFREGSAQISMGGLSYYPWFILMEMGQSLFMTWIYNNTGKSSLIAGYLVHAMFNTWPIVFLTNVVPGEPFPAFDVVLFKVATAVMALAAASLVIVTKGRLSHPIDETVEA